MNKKLALALSVTTAASLGFAGSATASPPADGNAQITGSMSGAPAYYDGLTWRDGEVSGSLTLVVNEASSQPIVMANLDLGSGFTISAVGSHEIAVPAGSSTDCVGVPDFEFEGEEDITAKGFSCSDNNDDGDGKINFELVANGISATTTIQSAGDYEVESQYRTNGSRRNKSYSWVVENETAINLSEGEPG